MKTPPKVRVRVTRESGINMLTVDCPHCGESHTHGGGPVSEPELRLGHRVAHCDGIPNPGYILVEADYDLH